MKWIEDVFGAAVCILALVGIFATTPTIPALIVLALLMVLS